MSGQCHLLLPFIHPYNVSIRLFPARSNNYCLTIAAEAAILRNVGGQVKPLLNDILALDNLLAFTQIIIIHHTDCGTTHFTNEQVRDVVGTRDPEVDVKNVDYGAINDLPKSIVRDVKFLKESKVVREELKETIKGFLYDIESGNLKEISV